MGGMALTQQIKQRLVRFFCYLTETGIHPNENGGRRPPDPRRWSHTTRKTGADQLYSVGRTAVSVARPILSVSITQVSQLEFSLQITRKETAPLN